MKRPLAGPLRSASSPALRPGLRARSTLAYHRASKARPRVAGGLRLVVVGIAMDDEALADDVRGAAADAHAGDVEHRGRVALAVRPQVGHVAHMALTPRVVVAMGLAAGVEVPGRAHSVARAAVALLVHVEAVLDVRLEPRDLSLHAN